MFPTRRSAAGPRSTRARDLLILADDRMCFGCGSRNPQGLRLTFTLDAHARRISTAWTPSKRFQGYADIVHGGMTGLVLDELVGNLLWKLGMPAVTAELMVRFHRPVRVGQPLVCEAWIAEHSRKAFGRVIHMAAEARTPDGVVMVSAAARCVRIESRWRPEKRSKEGS